MDEVDSVNYLRLFKAAFVIGAVFYFAYRILNYAGQWLPGLSATARKSGSAGIVAVGLTASVWFYMSDLLTCDEASAGLSALRLEWQKPGAVTKYEHATRGVLERRRVRYCNYFRDHCIDVESGAKSANWRFCLRSDFVSPAI